MALSQLLGDGLRHLKLHQEGKNAPVPHAVGLESQENCLWFHTWQRMGKSRGPVAETLAQALAVPSLSSFICLSFIISTKRAVLLGDNKCKVLLLKMSYLKKIGPELRHKSNFHLDFGEDVLICTHGSPCPLCLGLQYFREQRWQNNYWLFSRKKPHWIIVWKRFLTSAICLTSWHWSLLKASWFSCYHWAALQVQCRRQRKKKRD